MNGFISYISMLNAIIGNSDYGRFLNKEYNRNKKNNHKGNTINLRKNKDYVEVGRNQKCPCGSGKKYKNCCLESAKYKKYKEIGR